jgi:hypothetical protein
VISQAIAKALVETPLQGASRLCQTVVHPRALPTGRHETDGAQDAQVTGDVEVGSLEGLGQLAHADLPVFAQENQQPQAGRLGQGFEDGGFSVHEHPFVTAYLRVYVSVQQGI